MTTKKDAPKDDANKEEKVEKVVVEIIRGRMPLAIAAAIKLGSAKDAKDADLAANYRTTNGKISDIRNDRNFAYIKAGFKPSKADVEKAQTYADQLEDTKGVMAIVTGFGVATEDEEKEQAETRKSSRKTNGKPKADPKAKDDAKGDTSDEDDAADTAAAAAAAEDDLDDLLDD